MSFNTQEQEIIKFGIANGKSKQEVTQAISNYRAGVVPKKEEVVQPTESLGQKLGERAKTFASEVTLKPSIDILNNAQPTDNKDLVATESVLRAAQSPIRAVGAVGGALGDVVGAGLQATGLDQPIAQAISPVVQSEPVQKAMEVFKSLPQETQDVLGAIVNATNLPLAGGAKSLVTSGIETGVKTLKDTVSPLKSVVPKLTPDAEQIMQRVARVSKGKQANFEQMAGESIGSFLDKRGIYGDVDQITEQLYNRFQQSKNNADEALSKLNGNYQPTQVKTALTELENKLKSVSSEGAIDPQLGEVTGLLNKLKNQGLTMSEINQAKRLYERNVTLDFLKENNTTGVRTAKNIDNAIREWQFTQAEKLGLKNLPDINKETRLNKQLLDDLGREYAGSAGNNAITLTDWIMISGGDVNAIAGFLAKRGLSDKKIQSFIASKISNNTEKLPVQSGEFTTPSVLPIGTYKDFLKETSKSSKPSTQQPIRKESVSSPNTTPTTTKSNRIRGMVNFDEWIPKNEGKTLKKANGDSVVFTGKTEMIEGELKYELKDADGSDYVSKKTLERIADEQPTIDTTIAENKKSLDIYNKEKQDLVNKEQQVKDKAIERKTQSMELGGFTDKMTPMQKAKVASVLDKNIKLSTGEVVTKREYIKRRIDGGYEVSDTGILREKGKDAGYPLNKIESDYARYISNNPSELVPKKKQ